MPHVSDGELHMVLDGALDLLPDERVRAVRSHLESCEDCAARLERERRVRARAGEILRSGGPDDAELPPLGELRERAGSGGSGHRRKRLGLYRGVAWAASLILALGIGWYAGGGPGGPSPDRNATSGSPEGPGAAAGAERQERSEAPDASPVPGTASVEAEVAEAGRTDDPPDAPADAARAEPGRREPAAGRDLAERADAPEDDREAPGSAGVSGDRMAGEPGGAGGEERIVPDGPAGSLAVPGLPVLAVAWDEPGPDAARPALRILQALPSGDTLSLVYTPLEDGDDESGEETALEGVRELQRERNVAPSAAPDRAAPPESVDEAGAPETPADTASGETAAGPREGETSRRRILGDRWMVDVEALLPPDSLEALLRRIDPPPDGD